MVNHKVLLLDTGYSLYRLMQQNPTLREEFELLGLDFSDEVMVSDRSRLIEQISASVRSCQLVLLVDHAPRLRTSANIWEIREGCPATGCCRER